ncbi:Protein of unknown function [Bacillus wiedmannii]|uniref:Uncharacterized protein n=1 Tax=Bacillus wiedmannii TaxID=1890302 RepID=A0AB37YPK9_9BACI|nr:Protein of unknown function [Bacillus wiedmannii]
MTSPLVVTIMVTVSLVI